MYTGGKPIPIPAADAGFFRDVPELRSAICSGLGNLATVLETSAGVLNIRLKVYFSVSSPEMAKKIYTKLASGKLKLL